MSDALTRLEANPFPAEVPANIQQESPLVYAFLGELLRTIYSEHNRRQAGDSTFPWAMLGRMDAEPAFNLGSEGSFYHPDYGLIRAKYVGFQADELGPSRVWGTPVNNSKPWVLTNQMSQSAPQLAVGLAAPNVIPGAYGWVVCAGVYPYDLPAASRYAVLTRLGWTDNKLDSNAKATLAVLVDGVKSTSQTLIAGGLFLLGGGAGAAGSAFSDVITQELTDKFTPLQESIDDILAELAGLARGYRFLERVTIRVSDDEVLVAYQRILAASANFARLANSDSLNAQNARKKVFVLAQAAVGYMEMARVYQNQAGIFAEASQVSRVQALVSERESGNSAMASAESALTAKASETEAGYQAEAARTLALEAKTQAEGALSYAQASERFAAESFTSMDGSKTSAQASETSRLAAESAQRDARTSASASADYERLAKTSADTSKASSEASERSSLAANAAKADSQTAASASAESQRQAKGSADASSASAAASESSKLEAQAANRAAGASSGASAESARQAEAFSNQSRTSAEASESSRLGARSEFQAAQGQAQQAKNSADASFNSAAAAKSQADASGASAESARQEKLGASASAAAAGVTYDLTKALEIDYDMRLENAPKDNWWGTHTGGAIHPQLFKQIAWDNVSCMILPPGIQANIHARRNIPVDPRNRKYRISTRVGAYLTGSTPGSALMYVGFACLDAAGNYIDHGSHGTYRYAALVSGYITDGQIIEFSNVVSGEGNDSWTTFAPGTKQIQLLGLFNYNTGPLYSYIDYIRFEDITDSELSRNSANASQESYLASKASADASGAAASTSRGFRDESQAAAGRSQTSASNSADSASQANGFRAEAYNSSQLTAQYRDQAQGFRNDAQNARSDSQNLAAEALRQAQAASGHAGEAGRQAGLASGSATVANQARADADGFRSQSQQSSVLAAQYRDESRQYFADTNATLVNYSSVIADVKGRAGVYWAVVADAGGNRASIELRATNEAGGYTGFDITGNVRINGSLLVVGTVTSQALTPSAVQKISTTTLQYDIYVPRG